MAVLSHKWDRPQVLRHMPVGVPGKICSLTICDWACVGRIGAQGPCTSPGGGWGSYKALCPASVAIQMWLLEGVGQPH